MKERTPKKKRTFKYSIGDVLVPKQYRGKKILPHDYYIIAWQGVDPDGYLNIIVWNYDDRWDYDNGVCTASDVIDVWGDLECFECAYKKWEGPVD